MTRAISHIQAGVPVILLLAAVAVYDGWLLGGRVPLGEDHTLAFIPAYSLGEKGAVPRWNPYVCGGAPHFANPQYSAWYPPRWIFFFAEAGKGYGVFCFAHFVIAALAMLACLRSLGCGKPAACLGALSFACGSYVQGHLSNPGLLVSTAWLPWVVGGTFGAVERPSWGRATVLGAVLAMVVLAGSPHNIFYAGVIAGMAVVWGAGSHRRAKQSDGAEKSDASDRSGGALGAFLWAAAAVALACVVGAGLSAVQWLPTLEFLQLSARPAMPMNELARDPVGWDWLDNLFLGAPPPWPTEYLDKSAYFGMSALPLLIMAVVLPCHRRRAMFFVALSLVGLWISLGTQAGAFQVLANVPLARALSGPARALVLVAIGASALIGLGADAVLREAALRKRKAVWATVLVCGGLGAGLFWSKVGLLVQSDWAAIVWRAQSPRDPTLFPAINGGVALALGSAVMLAGLVLSVRYPPRRWLAWAAGLLLVLDLFHFRQRLPLPTCARSEFEPPETVQAVLRDSVAPFRAAGYAPMRVHPGDLNDTTLRPLAAPNLATLWRMQDIQGFDPLILRDYVRLVEATAGRSAIDDPVRMLNIARPDSTLFHLLNVRYVIGDVFERRVSGPPPRKNGAYCIALDSPTTLAGVSFVGLLDSAEMLGQGEAAAVVTVVGKECGGTGAGIGSGGAAGGDETTATRTATLLAGVHLADWRAADPRFPCRHSPAERNMVWTVETPQGPVRVANYYGRVRFDRPVVARAVAISPRHANVVLGLAAVGALVPETDQWERVFGEGRLVVYRNRRAPRGAWMVHRVRRVESEEAALAAVAGGRVDLAHEAVTCEAISVGAAEGMAGDARADVEFIRYDADTIEVKVHAARPGVLCFAEVFYPGWTAELDGRRVKVLRVNYLLRGIAIDTPGEHHVALRFSPRTLAAGKAISLLTLAVLVLWIAVGRLPVFTSRKGAKLQRASMISIGRGKI
ncbi:MAG: hypothetical protein N3D11_07905 [Candidatus Sumerlaeia bacterium]|nr:hypothetical protein [Candidatus Sumerlaeia bacterium]